MKYKINVIGFGRYGFYKGTLNLKIKTFVDIISDTLHS